METYNLTTLRKNLYQIVDKVLETGVPVEIERNGKKVMIFPVEQPRTKIVNLKKRDGIVGDPEELVDIKVSEWDESENLN